jgi:uncharacterized RDD family membrane protein YckC
MQQPDYSISTPENVDLHLEIAGLGNRLLAQLVDGFLISCIMLIVILLGVVLGLVANNITTDSRMRTIVIGVIVMVVILFMFILQNGYFFIFEGLWQGQTPGKKAAEIRVIEQNGQPIGWPAAFIRNLLRMVDSFFFIGVLLIIFDKTERRIGDMAAGTIVIRERKTEISSTAIKCVTAAAADLSLDVGRVSPDEYDLLIDFLRRRVSLAKSHRPMVAQRMAQHFRAKLDGTVYEEGQERPVESNPEQFLESLYLTYQQRAAE